MNFTYYIITPETTELAPMQREELWDLDSMYSIIGCDMVEVVRLGEIDTAYASSHELVVDEDGRRKHATKNPYATVLAGQVILGTVILTPLNTID